MSQHNSHKWGGILYNSYLKLKKHMMDNNQMCKYLILVYIFFERGSFYNFTKYSNYNQHIHHCMGSKSIYLSNNLGHSLKYM